MDTDIGMSEKGEMVREFEALFSIEYWSSIGPSEPVTKNFSLLALAGDELRRPGMTCEDAMRYV